MALYKKEKGGPVRQAAENDDPDMKAHVYSVEDAQAASAAEHSTTFKQAIRESWKAALWSAVISLTIVMEGYDQRSAAFKSSFPTSLADVLNPA